MCVPIMRILLFQLKPNPRESPTRSKPLLRRNCGKRTFVGKTSASGLGAGVVVTCGSPVTLRRRLITFSEGKAMCLSSQKMTKTA